MYKTIYFLVYIHTIHFCCRFLLSFFFGQLDDHSSSAAAHENGGGGGGLCDGEDGGLYCTLLYYHVYVAFFIKRY